MEVTQRVELADEIQVAAKRSTAVAGQLIDLSGLIGALTLR